MMPKRSRVSKRCARAKPGGQSGLDNTNASGVFREGIAAVGRRVKLATTVITVAHANNSGTPNAKSFRRDWTAFINFPSYDPPFAIPAIPVLNVYCRPTAVLF